MRRHIESFHVVDSHYCRANTSKNYLDSDLDISKLYDLYVKKSTDDQVDPVKEWLYRNIFKTEYNLDFHRPKKDRCEKCEEFKVAKENGVSTDVMEKDYTDHILEKMRADRDADKQAGNTVLCFDLENMVNLPKAEIGPLFYKRKLNLYNMTGHYSQNKQGYCAVWIEVMAGRAGDDIGSSVTAIVEMLIKDNPNIVNLVTWSASCVPQNRNQMICYSM